VNFLNDTLIGKLMHDFFCQNAEDMNYKVWVSAHQLKQCGFVKGK
jgi:hypothetical protein